MKRGSVVVDVAIDQGGCFETSRPTTYAEPTFVVDDVVHYCVANMPGAVPVTSSAALNNATLPYGLTIARGGLPATLSDPATTAGLNAHRGAHFHAEVGQSLQLPGQAPTAPAPTTGPP